MHVAHRFLLVLMAAAALSEPGCARLSGLRQRLLGSPRCVATPEITDAATLRDGGRGLPSLGGVLSTLRPQRPHRLVWQRIGASVEGRDIEAAWFGAGPSRAMLIGGIHGDEPEGQPLLARLAEELSAKPTLYDGTSVLIVRDLNPDGTAKRTRGNANGVDLNRNFPASNWESHARAPRFNPGPHASSEPETRLLVEVLREFAPARILVMHSTRAKPMVNYDGPARELAESLSRLNGYVTSDTIGYPTPGSLGSYAGTDLQLAIITLELPRGVATEEAWQKNRAALHQFVRPSGSDRQP